LGAGEKLKGVRFDHGPHLGALHDPRIGPIISKIHRHPGRLRTLGSLAAEAFMSRSAFSARFTELVGESATRNVTR